MTSEQQFNGRRLQPLTGAQAKHFWTSDGLSGMVTAGERSVAKLQLHVVVEGLPFVVGRYVLASSTQTLQTNAGGFTMGPRELRSLMSAINEASKTWLAGLSGSDVPGQTHLTLTGSLDKSQ